MYRSQNNELLLETVNASATPLLLKQGKIMGKAFIASEALSHIPAIHNMQINRSFISGDAAIQDPDSDKDSLPPLLKFTHDLIMCKTVSYEAAKQFQSTMTPPTYR